MLQNVENEYREQITLMGEKNLFILPKMDCCPVTVKVKSKYMCVCVLLAFNIYISFFSIRVLKLGNQCVTEAKE